VAFVFQVEGDDAKLGWNPDVLALLLVGMVRPWKFKDLWGR
jgi:hypothetical protein